MAYLRSPEDLVSAYRPIEWRNQQEVPVTTNVEKLKVEVYMSAGQLKATYRKDWYTSGTSTSGTSGTYNFDVDVQGVVQDVLRPSTSAKSSMFASTSAWQVVENTDALADVYIQGFYEYRDGNGLLVTSTAADVSSTAYAFIGTRQNQEPMTWDDHWYGASSGTIDFLTNAPTAVDIARDEPAFVSLITEGVNAVRFSFYASKFPGGSSSAVVRILDDINLGEIKMQTLALGPKQLIEDSAAVYLTPGTFPTSFTGLTHYTYQGIYFNTASSAITNRTVERRFDMVERCGHAVQFLFLNRLGGVDTYTFEDLVEKTQETAGEILERQLDWFAAGVPGSHQPYQRGRFKTNIESILKLSIRQELTTAEAEWLAELLSSPEVYLFQGDKFVNTVIEAGRQVLDRSRSWRSDFSLTAIIEDQFIQTI